MFFRRNRRVARKPIPVSLDPNLKKVLMDNLNFYGEKLEPLIMQNIFGCLGRGRNRERGDPVVIQPQRQTGMESMPVNSSGGLGYNNNDDPLLMLHPNIPIPLMKVPLKFSGYSNYGNRVYGAGAPMVNGSATSPIQVPLQPQYASGYAPYMPQTGYGYGPHSLSYGYRNAPYDYY